MACLWAPAPGITAPANGQPFAYFGHAVAISGDSALVGAYRENGTGAAYVYVRENGEWRRQARLVAADGELDDFFGWSVALEGDLAVVGAPTDDFGGLVDRGSIYAFRRTGDRWSLDARLVGPAGESGGRAGDRFGSSVAVSGTRILVGAPGADDPGLFNVGVGIVLVKPAPNEDWLFDASLPAPFGFSADSELGASVALQGNTALLGAPGLNLGAGAGQGAALVFSRQASWNLQDSLTALLPQPGDRFGTSVDLADNLALVGSPGRTTRGGAWGFLRTGSTWTLEREFFDSSGQPDYNFGWSVAIDGTPDSAVAFIGSYRRRTNGVTEAGAGAFFRRVSAGWGGFDAFYTAFAADAEPGDWYGYAVDLEGDTVIAGAVADDVQANVDQGSAYLHARIPGDTWPQIAKLTADTPSVDRFLADGFE